MTPEVRVELAIIKLETFLRHDGIRISVEDGGLELIVIIDDEAYHARLNGSIGEQRELPRHREGIGLEIRKNILMG